MKKKEKVELKDIKFNRALTKESAKVKYENLSKEKDKEAKDHSTNLVESKIEQAIANGEFENLPGKGKPLDLNKYYDLPEHLRIGYQMLRNAGFLPEEVRLKKEMGLITEKIKHCTSEKEKKKLMKELAEVSQQFHFHMEYNKKFKPS